MVTVRPYVAADRAALVSLSGMSTAMLDEHLDHPGYTPETDLFVAKSGSSLVAGRDIRVMGRGDESLLILESWSPTPAGFWNDDIQKQLFGKMLNRARAILTAHGRDRGMPQVRCGIDDSNSRALFAFFGLEACRELWTMECTRLDDIEQPVFPDAFEIRAYAPGQHDEAWRVAFNDAFSDHWGGWMQLSPMFWERYVARSTFRPDLSLVAWAGDEIAGFCHCRLSEDGIQGGIRYVGVRPQWRRQGLGEALTRAGMVRLRESGAKRVTLGVDATNTTSAHVLYEKNGFVVTRRIVMYRREIAASEPTL